MALADVVTTGGTTVEEALRLAGSLEDASEHPIAQAIAAGARSRGVELTAVESFTSPQGLGVQGVVDGHAVVARRARFLAHWALSLPDALRSAEGAAAGAARQQIHGAWAGAAQVVLS